MREDAVGKSFGGRLGKAVGSHTGRQLHPMALLLSQHALLDQFKVGARLFPVARPQTIDPEGQFDKLRDGVQDHPLVHGVFQGRTAHVSTRNLSPISGILSRRNLKPGMPGMSCPREYGPS